MYSTKGIAKLLRIIADILEEMNIQVKEEETSEIEETEIGFFEPDEIDNPNVKFLYEDDDGNGVYKIINK